MLFPIEYPEFAQIEDSALARRITAGALSILLCFASFVAVADPIVRPLDDPSQVNASNGGGYASEQELQS